jgi:four helix bundle protein
MAHFEDLVVWQEAKALTLAVYRIMREIRDYGFRDQIQRASASIMNNIAEGSDAGSDATNIRFLNIAKGSCSEVRSMLHLCHELGYCTKTQQEELIGSTRKISASINNLIKYINKKTQPIPPNPPNPKT